MQGKGAYIRCKVIGPFLRPAQVEAMCTRLPKVDALFYVIVLDHYFYDQGLFSTKYKFWCINC
jgi:hypothetical protein